MTKTLLYILNRGKSKGRIITKTLLYILNRVKIEFGLVGTIRLVLYGVFLPFIVFVTSYLVLKTELPSTFTMIILAILIFIIVIFFVIAKRAQSLEELIKEQKFKLSLHFTGDIVPIFEDVVGRSGVKSQGHTRNSKYVHVRVDSISGASVDGCTAYLKTLLKRGSDGKFIETELKESIPLNWSHGHGKQPKKIIPKVESLIDVVRTDSSDKKMIFAGLQPSKLDNIFDEYTIYKFEVVVNGGSVSKSIWIDVDWKGQWDTIEAKRGKASRSKHLSRERPRKKDK